LPTTNTRLKYLNELLKTLIEVHGFLEKFICDLGNWQAGKAFSREAGSGDQNESLDHLKDSPSVELMSRQVDFSYLISLLKRIVFVQVK
jgi:hypothetical protein